MMEDRRQTLKNIRATVCSVLELRWGPPWKLVQQPRIDRKGAVDEGMLELSLEERVGFAKGTQRSHSKQREQRDKVTEV